MKKTDTILIVCNKKSDLEYWKKESENFSDCEIVITNSIVEAINKWNKLFVKGCTPKAVVTDWLFDNHEVENTVDGITRSGPHYLLNYCNNMVSDNEVIFVVHTSSPSYVRHMIKGLPEERTPNIISKKEYTMRAVLKKIEDTLLDITHSSGLHTLHHA